MNESTMPKPEPERMTSVVPAPRALTWQMRFLWLLALFAVQLLYVPINRTMQGGVILDTPWDAYVPFWPVWAVPYLLSIVWWTGSFIWAAWKMEDQLYRALVAGTVAVMLASYVVYILFPTYVERPVLSGDSWAVELVRLIYSNDRLHNAFPSGHAYTTLLIVFFWWRWKPRLRWLWATIGVVVILSTLFTGQHNLPDPIGGLLFAWAGYHFGLWWAARPSAEE
jgi:membrane-associated phospholipid phosphatase